MKKLLIILTALFIVLLIKAESPQKISYQAIIRNAKGELVKNQAIGMKISIYFYNKTTPVTSYAETQTPTTNENGLVSIEIGTGKVVTGVFADINWAVRAFYLKTEIDPGGKTSYSIIADTQILSVPYALHAKTATTAESTSTISISGRNVELPYCADIDGNVYKTVKIGNQVWMAENLKTTRYRNGEVIPNVKDNIAWAALTTGAWCDNNYMAINGNKYGHLYNWYAVSDSRNLAPEGWHVPTDAEWTELENYLIANGGNWDNTTTGNKIAKSMAATIDWRISETNGAIGQNISINNSSGFTALPGGFRSINVIVLVGRLGYWWSSTAGNNPDEAFGRSLYFEDVNLIKLNLTKDHALSVRCVKD